VPLGGPEQRLVVTPDPGVDGRDGSWLPPSQLLISKDGVTRSIWPVHLAGWQALGWQLQPDAAHQSRSPNNQSQQPESQSNQSPIWKQAWMANQRPSLSSSQPWSRSWPAPLNRSPPRKPPLAAPLAGDAGGGEALLAAEPPDFQAMTKAQIVEYCSTVHGVDLDGSQTKAELIEQATALEAQPAGTTAEDLAALELGDALL
jgi:hypothetical protein